MRSEARAPLTWLLAAGLAGGCGGASAGERVDEAAPPRSAAGHGGGRDDSDAALRADDWGFTHGLSPILDPGRGAEAPEWISAEECGGCHQQQYADWSTSRHRVAWSNDILQAGYIAEPRDFCVYCHAPSAVQSAEVLANEAWYRTQHPNYDGTWRPERAPEPLAAEGVSCVACHWRGGAVLSAGGSGLGAPHRTHPEGGLKEPTLCKGCHEFPVPSWKDGEILLTDDLMQSTWSEWSRWAGGVEADLPPGVEAPTCQSCHMPGGRHLFRGAHDRDALRAAIRVKAERAGDGIRFQIWTEGVGHDMPTGDLFRNLTLEVESPGAGWVEIHRMGRDFEVVYDPALDRIVKRPAGDTTLKPGVPQTVTWPPEGAAARGDGPIRWRMRYHYGSPFDEGRGLLAADAIIAELWSGAAE